MKKINYKLKIAIISKEVAEREIFTNFLNEIAIERVSNHKNVFVYELIHQFVPIRMYIYFFKSLDELSYDPSSIEGFDILLLTLNVYDIESLKIYQKDKFLDFCRSIDFKGSSLLVALNIMSMNTKEKEENLRISRFKLIRKCNDLNLAYCFEIIKPKKDLLDMFERILNETIFKFKVSKPELFQKAIDYGKEISKQK